MEQQVIPAASTFVRARTGPVCLIVVTRERHLVSSYGTTELRTIGLEPITVMDVILSHKRIPFRQARMFVTSHSGTARLAAGSVA
jgi:hypothetical protein